MKVQVRAFLTAKEALGGQTALTLEVEPTSVLGLLHELCRRFGDDFSGMVFDRQTGAVSQGMAILINGRHFRHLPDGLNTELESGDEVSLFPPLAGG
jgi:molybdopterin synthase sulfur carrier subunit